jgi:hypothetical protein
MFREPGTCAFCGEQIQPIVRTGTPPVLGSLIPGCKRMTVVLVHSGHIANLTRCPDCPDNPTPKALRDAWQRSVRTAARDLNPEYRRSQGMPEMEPGFRETRSATLCMQLIDIPLGILAEESWEDVTDVH